MKNFLKLLLAIFMFFQDLEGKCLEKSGPIWLFAARAISFVLIFSILLFIHLVSMTMVMYISEWNKWVSPTNTQWWTIPLLIVIPVSIPLITNFTNRDYNFSEKFVELITVLEKYPRVSGIRRIIEITGFVIYVVLSSYLTLDAMLNFLPEHSIVTYLQTQGMRVVYVLFVIHSAIYISVRVFIQPTMTRKQQLIKASRRLFLWFLACCITVAYVALKIGPSTPPVELLYYAVTLLLAVDRLLVSYNDFKSHVSTKYSGPRKLNKRQGAV